MKQFIVSLTVALLASLMLAAPPVSAANLFGRVDCNKAIQNSKDNTKRSAPVPAVCEDRNTASNPLTGNNGVIMKITNIVAAIAGVAAVIIIILSGLKFVLGAGDANEVAAARRSLIYALVGLLIIVAARFIISLVIGSL